LLAPGVSTSQARLLEIRAYLDAVLEGKLPVNHEIMGHLQDVFNLLPNLNLESMVQHPHPPAPSSRVAPSGERRVALGGRAVRHCRLWLHLTVGRGGGAKRSRRSSCRPRDGARPGCRAFPHSRSASAARCGDASLPRAATPAARPRAALSEPAARAWGSRRPLRWVQVEAFAVKSNDMMLVMYLSSMIRSVVSLHNLINNKVVNKEAERSKDLKDEGLAKKADEKKKEKDEKQEGDAAEKMET